MKRTYKIKSATKSKMAIRIGKLGSFAEMQRARTNVKNDRTSAVDKNGGGSSTRSQGNSSGFGNPKVPKKRFSAS